MRKIELKQELVRNQVGALVGKRVRLLVNRGRRRIERYSGVLTCAYPAIFTVRIDDPKLPKTLTYAYADIICGEVKIMRPTPEDAEPQELVPPT